MAKKRGYKTVTLRLSKRKRLKLYTSERAVNAAYEVLEKLETLYYGTRLGQVLEAVRRRGQIEGRAQVIEKLDGVKKSLLHRLPGRPRKS